ncbi:WbqC family protein [Bacilliculturomica massiliensis]|uniref:WbqC family protein n=1 Tax=Bacilliculturomica massiliensis TaxID=1917867 RepID=UPI001031A71D|nr:WbqC family protein [Bacilliculturomica massiliensis]
MKKVAVLQSNYIPWKGYFDIIHDVDLFVFYDDVQYTTRDWRNRNTVKTKDGIIWLTVPTGSDRNRTIDEVQLSAYDWQRNHYDILYMTYSKTKYFNMYKDFLENVFLEKKWGNLSQMNQYIIKYISKEFLSIETEFSDSRSFGHIEGKKHTKLLNLVKATGAQEYLSGPAAQNYIIEKDYTEAGIKLSWKDYSNYPEYDQVYPPFTHNVSILDLLFHTGEEAPYYIWGWREEKMKSVADSI